MLQFCDLFLSQNLLNIFQETLVKLGNYRLGYLTQLEIIIV